MKEFTPEKLFEWRNNGIQYIGINIHVPELTLNDETTEFIVTPFATLEDAHIFIEGKRSIATDDEQSAAVFFIDSTEAFEVATGMINCKFYTPSKSKSTL